MHTSPSPLHAATYPHTPGQIPKVRTNTTGWIAFLSISGMCMLNINFLTRAFVGMEQAFSVLYLLACVVLLFTFRFRIGQAIGKPGTIWLIAIFLFLAVSTRMGAGIDLAYFTSPSSNLYRIVIAQLITVSAALGARHLVLAGRLQPTLRILFGFTVMAACTIILTKKLPWILHYVGSPNQDRSGGFFADPNRAGQSVCIAAAYGFACLAGEKTSKWKLFAYTGLVILIPCLFMTYSRSSILFMAVLVMLQFVISPILKRKESMIAILVVALGIPFGVNTVLQKRASHVNRMEQADAKAQQERMESLFRILSGDFDHADTGHRLTLAVVGLRYFASNPVIGAGFRQLALMPEVGLGCHNTFLRIFGEAGLFAGIAFVGALVFVALCGWRCQIPQIKCLVIGYIAMYSCACMVSHTLLTNRLSNVSMGICLGFISGAIALRQQEARRKRSVTVAMQMQRQAALSQTQQPASSI